MEKLEATESSFNIFLLACLEIQEDAMWYSIVLVNNLLFLCCPFFFGHFFKDEVNFLVNTIILCFVVTVANFC